MSRKNVEHTPESLRELGDELIEAGKKIQASARLMRRSGVSTLSLAHQSPIDLGLKSVDRFILGLEHKIATLKLGDP